MDRIKVLDDWYENTRYNGSLDWSHPKFTHNSWCWDNTKRSAHIRLQVEGKKFWDCPQFMLKDNTKDRYLGKNEANLSDSIPRFLDHDGYPICEYQGLMEGCDNA